MSETKTTWRVEWKDHGGSWRKYGVRGVKAQAIQLRDEIVKAWWFGKVETRIIRIETTETVEEER